MKPLLLTFEMYFSTLAWGVWGGCLVFSGLKCGFFS